MLTLLRQQTNQSSAQTSTAIRRQHLQSYLMVWGSYAVHQSHCTFPGGSIVLECVADLPWNQWQLSLGIAGRLAMESVARLAWNTQSDCRGLPNRLPALYSIN